MFAFLHLLSFTFRQRAARSETHALHDGTFVPGSRLPQSNKQHQACFGRAVRCTDNSTRTSARISVRMAKEMVKGRECLYGCPYPLTIYINIHTDIHVDIHTDIHADIHANIHADVRVESAVLRTVQPAGWLQLARREIAKRGAVFTLQTEVNGMRLGDNKLR